MTGFTRLTALSPDIWRLAALHYWRSLLPVQGEVSFWDVLRDPRQPNVDLPVSPQPEAI